MYKKQFCIFNSILTYIFKNVSPITRVQSLFEATNTLLESKIITSSFKICTIIGLNGRWRKCCVWYAEEESLPDCKWHICWGTRSWRRLEEVLGQASPSLFKVMHRTVQFLVAWRMEWWRRDTWGLLLFYLYQWGLYACVEFWHALSAAHGSEPQDMTARVRAREAGSGQTALLSIIITCWKDVDFH
jgi:hypothetical protein